MSSEICALPNAVLEAGFCAYELPIQVNKPRSVLSIGTTEILALERGTSSVIHLFDSDDDGIPDMKRTVVTGNTLNHGLALHEGYLYASSDTTVYRWSYEGDDFTSMGEEEIFVNNINENGMGGAPEGHRTRTMAFDELGRLYISVGSGGIDFQAGEVFADGLRNEVGLAFDKHGVLWGVENSADRLSRDNMGGDIHNDNPVRII
jgi:glucose/arabinose dehydrogenase